MKEYQRKLIEFLLEEKVLVFGAFQLKSGRTSPYFFNAGLFASGKSLTKLATFYADALLDSEMTYSVLFGPAYKGIPLVAATSVVMFAQHNINASFCYNRKERKDHGEGGQIVGEMHGDVVIIDDVITAGTAIRESMRIIKENSCHLSGVLVALDRQEKGLTELSAIQEIEADYNVKVVSIIKLEHIIEYIADKREYNSVIESICAYRVAYGTK